MLGRHVVLSTPTGSGKSLVALCLHFQALCRGQRSFYTAPVKALASEKFFSLCNDFGARCGRDADRGRQHQPLGPGGVLHRRGAREHGAAPGRGARRAARRDGRVPFLLGSRTGQRLADPAAPAPANAVPADVGHARQHGGDRGAAARPQRSRRRARAFRAAPGAARLRIPRDADPRDLGRSGRAGTGARLRGELHAARVRRARARAHQRELLDARGAGAHRGGARLDPVRHAVRQGHVPDPAPRDRRPPRGSAAPLPAAGGKAGAARPAEGRLRHGHARRGRQHPDPHGALLQAEQVRRREGRDPARARVPPDRRSRRPQGLRRARQRGLPGARTRDPEPPRSVEARRQEERGEEEAAARLRALDPRHLRPADREPAGDARLRLRRRPRRARPPAPAAGGGRAARRGLALGGAADRALPRDARFEGASAPARRAARALAAPRRHRRDHARRARAAGPAREGIPPARLLALRDALALSGRGRAGPRPRLPHVRPRGDLAGRGRPREPDADPARAARPRARRADRAAQGGGRAVRGPDPPSRGRELAPARGRVHRRDLPRVRREPPLGGRVGPPSEGRGARDVRILPGLRRPRARARRGAQRGDPAALPLAGARHAGAQPAGCGQDQCRLRRDRLLPHRDPGRRREPAAGLAGAARSCGRRQRPRLRLRRSIWPRTSGRCWRARAPSCTAWCARSLTKTGRRRPPACASTPKTPGTRIASRRRSRRSSRSTAALDFTPAARLAHRTRFAAAGPRRWQVAQVLVDPAGDELWALHGEVDLSREKDPEGPLVRLLRIGP